MNTPATRPPEKLPDPWLFNSESLLRGLDRCRELVLEISIAHPHQTHFDINIAVNALWNLRENLRYLLALHLEGQRAFAKQSAEVEPKRQKKTGTDTTSKIVRIGAQFTSRNPARSARREPFAVTKALSRVLGLRQKRRHFLWPPFALLAFPPKRRD